MMNNGRKRTRRLTTAQQIKLSDTLRELADDGVIKCDSMHQLVRLCATRMEIDPDDLSDRSIDDVAKICELVIETPERTISMATVNRTLRSHGQHIGILMRQVEQLAARIEQIEDEKTAPEVIKNV